MEIKRLREFWEREEAQAYIHGWDFSHIEGRYDVENDLPWNYERIIRDKLKDTDQLLDIDTGGGEFLLSLRHPAEYTAATEGYPLNVELCKERLLPLGIDFKEMSNYAEMPFEDEKFDLVINRHGNYNISELYRVLKKGGLYITDQVGEDNDRELVELLLPGTPKPFHGLNLKEQKQLFEQEGFEILQADECMRPIKFYDVGALVWFAHIIEWEFPGFSVNKCFLQLCRAQRMIEEKGVIEAQIHRYLIVARK